MRFLPALVFALTLSSTAVRADEAPSAFYIDVTGTPADVIAAKYVNWVLNRMSQGKQLMAVQAGNVQNGIVSIDLKTLMSDDQRRSLAKLVPGPGRPLPLWALLEGMLGPMAPELDGVHTKADLERLAGFSEKEMPAPNAKAKGVRETFYKQSDLKMFVRRIHPENPGAAEIPGKKGKPATPAVPATPAFEQWIVTFSNGSIREYFFGMDGKRLVTLPEGMALGGRGAIEHRLTELKRSRSGFGESKPWYAIHDLARRADMAASSPYDAEIRKFLVADKKRRDLLPTPTPSVAPQTPGASPETVSKEMLSPPPAAPSEAPIAPPPPPSPASVPQNTPAGNPLMPPQ